MDAKGRMAMPTKHRDALNFSDSGQLIATIDIQSRCLLIYPLSEWEVIENNLKKLPSMKKTTRRMQRLMLGYASELEMDANGRVLLPQALRDYAELEKKLVLVGQMNKFELWSEDKWAEETELALGEVSETDLEESEDLQDFIL
jgi:MraZ protein